MEKIRLAAIEDCDNQEIVSMLRDSKPFAEAFNALLDSVYADDAMVEYRPQLMAEATTKNSPYPEWNMDKSSRGEKAWTEDDMHAYQLREYPLAFGPEEGIPEEIRVIAKIRAAIKKVCERDPSGGLKLEAGELLRRTGDGDLGMRYYYDAPKDQGTFIADMDPFEFGEKEEVVFSPEMQVASVEGVKDREYDGYYDTVLFSSIRKGQLCPQAWNALLEANNDITEVAVLTANVDEGEVREGIMANPQLKLLFEARTDADAQMKLYEKRYEYKIDIPSCLARLSGLANEELALKFIADGGMPGYLVGRNEEALARMPKVREAFESSDNYS